jgi:GT2 family glycosyltransferase
LAVHEPDAGIAGAKLLFPDGVVQPSCRRFPTFSSFVARRTPLRFFMRSSAANARHLMLNLSSEGPMEVDWVLGACMFVRRDAIQEVGLLDEGFYLYVEDIDWCYRMRQKGWKTWWVPEAEVVHHHQATSDRTLMGWHSWIHLKSMVRYYRKHLAPRFLRLGPAP